MSSRFELEGTPDGGENPPPFSMDSGDEPAGPRFVVESDDFEPGAAEPSVEAGQTQTASDSVALQPNLLLPEPDSSWRDEVADRVNRYRARRRPRAPRYPSLTLKFEAPEPRNLNSQELPPPATHQALAMDSAPLPAEEPAGSRVPTEGAKVLEFPRAVTLPSQPLDELADPVVDRPRILEVPEVAPPPPALGGILIEPTEVRAEEKRPGFEIPLQPAPMSRRLGSAAIDLVFVLGALALFAYIFWRVVGLLPPVLLAAEMSIGVAAVLWAGYQYLALVLGSSTPGLKLARLELCRFDGTPVPRRLRRWRTLASLLSAVSLGLGYAWCFLDEDQLCWHDRITRTYMAPKNTAVAPTTKLA